MMPAADEYTDGENIEITEKELREIRSLGDFDLTMLLSEIHDHGWPQARVLLPLILKTVARQ